MRCTTSTYVAVESLQMEKQSLSLFIYKTFFASTIGPRQYAEILVLQTNV